MYKKAVHVRGVFCGPVGPVPAPAYEFDSAAGMGIGTGVGVGEVSAFDPTEWTVDDPDIASVARYL